MTTIHDLNMRFSPAGMNFLGDLVLLGNVGIMTEPKAVQNRQLDFKVTTNYLYRQNAFIAFELSAADFCESPKLLALVKEHLNETPPSA